MIIFLAVLGFEQTHPCDPSDQRNLLAYRSLFPGSKVATCK